MVAAPSTEPQSDVSQAPVQQTAQVQPAPQPQAKYIPPHMRARMAAEQQRQQQQSSAAPQPAAAGGSADQPVVAAPPQPAPAPREFPSSGPAPTTFHSGPQHDSRARFDPARPDPRSAQRFESLREGPPMARGGGYYGGGYRGGRDRNLPEDVARLWEVFAASQGTPEVHDAWRSPTSVEEVERLIFGEKQEIGVDFGMYESIPVEVSAPSDISFKVPPPVMSFEELHLPDPLPYNIARANIKTPTPIQKFSIPIANSGIDIMACAPTGSGKTASFLLPILTRMLESGPPEYVDCGPVGRPKSTPVVLILCPTRELAQQTHKECFKFMWRTGMIPQCIFGGAPFRDQAQRMRIGCDVLVATPGRLIDFLERGMITMANVHYLVLDEADRMLEMGFEEQIRAIIAENGMPGKRGYEAADGRRHADENRATDELHDKERQTLMFSATFPKAIRDLATDFLCDYAFVRVGSDDGSGLVSIIQQVRYVSDRDKDQELLKILGEAESGIRILIFVETKRAAADIEYMLYHQGYPVSSIHGDRTQEEREWALDQFRRGKTPVLVATDVAQRGLHIPDVAMVINYDMPRDIADYTHRIGRTGRVGHRGVAVSFVNEGNVGIARALVNHLNGAGQNVPDFLMEMATRRGSGPSGSAYGRGGRRGGYGGGPMGGYGGGPGGGYGAPARHGGYGSGAPGYGGRPFGGGPRGGGRSYGGGYGGYDS